MTTIDTDARPADITLPGAWTWERVEEARARWDIAPNMVPVACAPGVTAWATINSVRLAAELAANRRGELFLTAY